MKPRIQPLGNRNCCGANITHLRNEKNMKQKELLAQMQTLGVDINPSSLSKLEGQTRPAFEQELIALSKIFNITIDELVKL
ncbi:MAG: helix-turn-helix transcriptional regulator [Hydrogenoanaerobacterium sp.]